MTETRTWPALIIEFTDIDDPRMKEAFCENVESDTPLPIADVGDTVYVTEPGELAMFLRVERRLFSYHPDWTHVQLFCRKVDSPLKD